MAYDGSGEITTTAKTAETTGISPVWTPAAGDIAVAEISYSIAAAATGTVPSTDGTGTAVVIDSTSGKVTLTDQVLVANGGEYVVTATAGAASNYQQDSTQTATITVTVSKIPVTGLSYSSQSIDANAYSAITALTPTTVPNGATGSYSGNLPAGLEVHPTTGIISGTPTTVTAKASYTVTFNADGEYSGSPTADIEISVKKPDLSAATLAYNPTSISTIEGTATGSGITPTWTPVQDAPPPTNIVYSIAAAAGDDAPTNDGAGNAVQIDSSTGEVTLTDQAIVANSGQYVVRAAAGPNSNYQEGSAETTTIAVGISAKTSEEVTSLSYSPSSIDVTIGTAILAEPAPTTVPAGATGTYSASLPDGLKVHSSTGIISGTPTTNAEAKLGDYVVTFTASGDYYGSPTATITIDVKKPNLNTAALAYDGSGEITTTAKTANSTGISPDWTPAAGDIAVTEISYSIAAGDNRKQHSANGRRRHCGRH